MAAAPSVFFKIERTAPEIKSELLPRIFEVWATAMLPQMGIPEKQMRFIDMQAGLDLDESTPAALHLLRQLYKSTGARTDLNKVIGTVYFDRDKSALAELQKKVEQLPFYQELVHPPVMLLEENEEAIAEQLMDTGQPTLAFLHPTSEGIAQQFLLHTTRTVSSDLLMLFNPKEMEAAVKKAKAGSLFHEILGVQLEQIKAFYKQNKSADKREAYVLDCFEDIFRSSGFYTLIFRINYPDRRQTNQFFVLASTSPQAYTRLKELLEGYSDYQEDGVPLFGANLQQQQTALFHEHYTYSIANLVQELTQMAAEFSNRTVQYVYEQHSIGTHYTLANYQVAYEKLMRQGVVRFINPKTGQPISKLTPISLIRYKK